MDIDFGIAKNFGSNQHIFTQNMISTPQSYSPARGRGQDRDPRRLSRSPPLVAVWEICIKLDRNEMRDYSQEAEGP